MVESSKSGACKGILVTVPSGTYRPGFIFVSTLSYILIHEWKPLYSALFSLSFNRYLLKIVYILYTLLKIEIFDVVIAFKMHAVQFEERKHIVLMLLASEQFTYL